MREEKMKKYFVFLCYLLFAVLFISCGKDENSGSPASRPPVVTSSNDGSSNSPKNPDNPASTTDIQPVADPFPNMLTNLQVGDKIGLKITSIGTGKYELSFKHESSQKEIKMDIDCLDGRVDVDKARQLGNIKDVEKVYVSVVKDNNAKYVIFFYGDNSSCDSFLVSNFSSTRTLVLKKDYTDTTRSYKSYYYPYAFVIE
jgi:hypothetical protein